MLLSVVVPVFNEVELAPVLLRRVMAMAWPEGLRAELVVVDDGSTDGTREALRELARETGGFRLIEHERNRGKGAAVRTGFAAARGEVWIVQDADLEYDPEEIPEVVAPIREGRARVVYGSRVLKQKASGNAGVLGLMRGRHPHSYPLAYLGGVTVTKWTNLLTGARLTDEPTCYKCFRRDALEGIELEADDFAWEPEVTVKLLRRGERIEEVPISYHPRRRAEGKKINWRDGVKALWTVARHRWRKAE